MAIPDAIQHDAIPKVRDIEQSINERLRELHDSNREVTALVGAVADGPTLVFNVADGDAALTRLADQLLAMIKPIRAAGLVVGIVPDEFQIAGKPLKALRIAVSVQEGRQKT